MKSPINMNENVPHFEKISVLFFDLGEISRFDSFFDRQKTVKTRYLAQIKKRHKYFLKIWNIVIHIYWGFHQKLGARGDTWFFLASKLSSFDGHF